MDSVASELRALAHRRCELFSNLALAIVVGAMLVLLLPLLTRTSTDTVSAYAFVLIVFSVAVVRGVADGADALEQPCPRCGAAFFGGVRRALAALPLPPPSCRSCGLALSGPARLPAAERPRD